MKKLKNRDTRHGLTMQKGCTCCLPKVCQLLRRTSPTVHRVLLIDRNTVFFNKFPDRLHISRKGCLSEIHFSRERSRINAGKVTENAVDVAPNVR